MNEKIELEREQEPVREIGYVFLFELDEKEKERRMEQLKERLAADARG